MSDIQHLKAAAVYLREQQSNGSLSRISFAIHRDAPDAMEQLEQFVTDAYAAGYLGGRAWQRAIDEGECPGCRDPLPADGICLDPECQILGISQTPRTP